MTWFPESKDRLPLTWWNRHPVYLAALVALGGVISMVLTAVVMAADESHNVIRGLVFTYSNLFDRGFVWTLFTYPLVNPPSIWLVLTSYFFWRFGEDVERYLGRKVFAKLLVALTLSLPLAACLMGLAGHTQAPAVGIDLIELGVFVAFATLYPRAELSLIICSVKAWIIAVVIVGVDALQYLAVRYWPGVVMLGTISAVGYGYVRYEQGHLTLPKLRLFRRSSKPKLRVVPPVERRSKHTSAPDPNAPVTEEEVDAILDKIKARGMQSLTPEERQMLEKASEGLNQRKNR